MKHFDRKEKETGQSIRSPRESKKVTTWGHVADWYEEHLLTKDTYHEKLLLPNLTRLIDPQQKDHILDLPCGQGYFASAFAALGAEVTAIDISEELVSYAKRKNDPGVRYLVAPSHKLRGVSDGSINKAAMILGIQNIEKVGETFAEVSRVLTKHGELHIVMNHPAFRIPKESSWEWDRKKQLQYRRVDRYLSESHTTIDMHPGKHHKEESERVTTVSFHRPLQYYFKFLGKNGFGVDKLEEWISHRKSDSGPRMEAENIARKEFPLFLYLRAKKY